MEQGSDDNAHGGRMSLDADVIDEIYARLAGRLMNDLRSGRGASGTAPSEDRTSAGANPGEWKTELPGDGGQTGSGDGPSRDFLPGLADLEFDRDASAELLRVLAQAQLSWLTRGFRYWGQVAEIHQGLMSTAVESLAAAASAEPAAQTRPQLEEQVTRYLRELSELSSREARLLQVELERLAASVRDTLGDERVMDTPRRWARAKP